MYGLKQIIVRIAKNKIFFLLGKKFKKILINRIFLSIYRKTLKRVLNKYNNSDVKHKDIVNM
jgi:hypothetical protein